MSQAWPSDRKFVDRDGKIVDPWMGPLQQLKPLLRLTPADFVTLQALILAAQNATEDDPFSLSAAIAALSVDGDPDLAADYVVSYDGTAAHRVLMSALSSGKELISTTSLSGTTGAILTVPTGYTDIELVALDVSTTATENIILKFSEDGGSTFLTHVYNLFNSTVDQIGTTTDGEWCISNLSASSIASGSARLLNYESGTTKITTEHGIVHSGSAWAGTRVITSTAAINAISFGTGSAMDGGTLELWGMP